MRTFSAFCVRASNMSVGQQAKFNLSVFSSPDIDSYLRVMATTCCAVTGMKERPVVCCIEPLIAFCTSQFAAAREKRGMYMTRLVRHPV